MSSIIAIELKPPVSLSIHIFKLKQSQCNTRGLMKKTKEGKNDIAEQKLN